MQVILKEDIRSLGKAGEVVKVAEGYGRNYLLPLKKAVDATESNLRRLETELASIQAKRERLKKEAEELGQKLGEMTLTLEREAGEEDKLFGTVTTRQIAEELARGGVKLDHRNFALKEPIRKLGAAMVEIHLHGDVTAQLKVEVKKK